MGSGSNIGGFTGANTGNVDNSFWDNQTSGWTSSSSGIGKTTVEMMTKSTFPGWNFTLIGNGTIWTWIMAGYPHLQMEHTTKINNVVEFQLIAVDLQADYTLENNLNASATSTWNWNADHFDGLDPIGNDTDPFTGSLDCQGYDITGLLINRSGEDCVGLFGYMGSGSSIYNLELVNSYVIGNGHVGGIAGVNFGTISNITNHGNIIGFANDISGVVGLNFGTSTNTIHHGKITGYAYNTGGIVGWVSGNITNAVNYGSVVGNIQTGGIAGQNNGGTITNTANQGNVTSSGYNVGGIVGYTSK